MIYDALEMSYRTVRVNKDPDCAICGKNPTITELIDYEAFCGAVSEEAAGGGGRARRSAPRTWRRMLDRGDNIFLVDVREPNEYEIVSIPGATLIPKGEFLNGSALEKLPQDKQIVLHCKSGARSAEVLAVAEERGLLRRGARRRRRPGLGQPGRPVAPDVLNVLKGSKSALVAGGRGNPAPRPPPFSPWIIPNERGVLPKAPRASASPVPGCAG